MKDLIKRYKGLFIGGIFVLLIIIIIGAAIILIWRTWFPNDYVLDLSIKTGDILQIFVILVAILGPFTYSYIDRRRQMPIVELIFHQEAPFVYTKNKYHFPGDKTEPSSLPTFARHYSVKIKNTGRSRLLNCEGVILGLWKYSNGKYQKMSDRPQIVLKWNNAEFRKSVIDINPKREEPLLLFYFPDEVSCESSNDTKLTFYHASDTVNEMEMIEYGEYILQLNVFSSNAEMEIYHFHLSFSKGIKSKKGMKPEAKLELILHKPNDITSN